MKISELIAELEKIKEEHGDLPIFTGNDMGDWEIDSDDVFVLQEREAGKLSPHDYRPKRVCL